MSAGPTAGERRDVAAAARALERAAQLTPPSARRVERLLASTDTARQAGCPEHALGLLRDAADEATDARVRAEIARRRLRLEWFRSRARHAERLYRDAARLLEPSDPAAAALLFVAASLAAQHAGAARAARTTSCQATAAAARTRDTTAIGGVLARFESAATAGVALYWIGEAREAHQLLSHEVSTVEDRHLAALDPEALLFVLNWRAWTGIAPARSRELVERIVDEARAAGALGLLPWALHVAIHFLLRDGEWARAYAAAAEGARIGAEAHDVLHRHHLLGYMALIEGAQRPRTRLPRSRRSGAGADRAQRARPPSPARLSARAARARRRPTRTGAAPP